MLPFTVEQFLDVFAAYNQAVWPMPVILVLLAGAAVFLALRPHSFSDHMITAVLAFFWLWTGVAYHLAFFSRVNRGAYAFGVLCIVQAVLFLFAGVVRRKLTFRAQGNALGLLGGLFMVYALLAYPALGDALGHQYPYSPTFGAPCPTTIFTFGLLLWTKARVARYVLWVPLLWSLIGISAAASLGMREDLGLPITGIAGTILILRRDRRTARPVPAGARYA
jgi:hypothetical protein